jgi:UPF0716 protein FxsA
MRFLAIAGLIALAEMATFLWVGSRIGFGWALGIALVTALLGSFLVRRAGLAAWGRIRRKLGDGQLPGREMFDGAAILVAGAFLISPGFITDTLGFLLLIPAVRARVHRMLTRRVSSRFNVFVTGRTPTPLRAEVEIIDVEPID